MAMHNYRLNDLKEYFAVDRKTVVEVDKANISTNLKLKYAYEGKHYQNQMPKSSKSEINALKRFFKSEEKINRTKRNEKFKNDKIFRNQILSQFIETYTNNKKDWEYSEIDELYKKCEGFDRDIVRNIIFTIQFRNEKETLDFKNASGAFQYAILFQIWKKIEAGIYQEEEILEYLKPNNTLDKLLILPLETIEEIESFSNDWHIPLKDYISFTYTQRDPPKVSPTSLINNWFSSLELVLLPPIVIDDWRDNLKQIYRKNYYREGFRLGWKKEQKEDFYNCKIKEKMKKKEELLPEEICFLKSKGDYWIRRIVKPDYILRDFLETVDRVKDEFSMNGLGGTSPEGFY